MSILLFLLHSFLGLLLFAGIGIFLHEIGRLFLYGIGNEEFDKGKRWQLDYMAPGVFITMVLGLAMFFLTTIGSGIAHWMHLP